MEVSNFVLDDVMFLESYRYARQEFGHIYLQKFPSAKLYAGQTINFKERMRHYRKNRGNNNHHTKALKKYGFDNVVIAYQQCPLYLLDTVEIFLIAFFDLTDNKKGYNKTTGGRKWFCMSANTRAKQSTRMTGEKNHMYGRKGEQSPIYGEKNGMFGMTGELNPFYGKKHTVETLAILSIKLSGKNSPWFGRHHTKEWRANMSESQKGEKNHGAKPICAFGKLYPAAVVASDTLREVCKTKSKGNFMKNWVQRKSEVAFYVAKEFYEFMSGKDEQITREMYDEWLSSTA